MVEPLPPPPKSTRDATIDAALGLMKAGRRPTAAAVRALTRRGSAGTIQKYLQDLLIALAVSYEAKGNIEWPHEIPPQAVRAFIDLWDTLLAVARDRYQAQLGDASQGVAQAIESARMAEEARIRLESHCDALRRDNLRLEEFRQQARRQVDDEIVARRSLEKKYEALLEHLKRGKKKQPRRSSRRKANMHVGKIARTKVRRTRAKQRRRR